jgi:SAM-dependent methyltransferase
MNDKNLKLCSNGQERIWAHFQNQCRESFDGAKPRMDYIIREITRKSIASVPRVLNIGVGNGYFEEAAKRVGWNIYSLDPDEMAIKRLSEIGVKAHKGYIEGIPFDDYSFDFVIASEVLEHLSEEQFHKGIREVVRVTGQGGWFIGTVPYCEDLFLNQVLCPKCEEVFHRWGHKKSFDIKTIRDELSHFFSKVVVNKRAFVALKGQNFVGILEGLVRLILAKCGAKIASTNIYFIARK